MYKTTIGLCGLLRQMVFYDRENQFDFVKTEADK